VGGNFRGCFCITQVKDSGYIISGRNNDSAILFKINKLGDVSWIKRYSKFGRNFGRFYDHKITNDGGIIACGSLYDPSIGYVVKTDSVGNIKWDSVYNYTSDILRIIESTKGSIYILAIQTKFSTSNSYKKYYNIFKNENDYNFQIRKNVEHSFYTNGLGITLSKIDSLGKLIWKRDLVISYAIDLIEHPSGYIFVSGGLDSMILYKIDTSGSTIFQKSYYPGSGAKGTYSMCLSREENILLAGARNTTMVVSKIDPVGNIIFNKSLPTINNTKFAFLPFAVNSTNDSGFIFTGFTNYPPNFYESNIYASKTDSMCNAPLIVGIENNNILIPEVFVLYQNYPNPFNPNTTIRYDLNKTGFVNLKIFDLKGKEICTLINEVQQPGEYKFQFNSVHYNLSSGLYYCKISIVNNSSIIKLVLIK
jgi:hypothetical protein